MKDINLLPDEIKSSGMQVQSSENQKEIPKKGILIGIVVVAIIVASILIPKARVMMLDSKLDSIQKELQSPKYVEIKNINSQLASISGVLQSKKEVIESIDSSIVPVNEILTSLKHVAPSGCVVNSLEYDGSILKVNVKVQDALQLGEFLLNASRLDFLTPDDSMKTINISSVGEFVYSFKVGRKGEK